MKISDGIVRIRRVVIPDGNCNREETASRQIWRRVHADRSDSCSASDSDMGSHENIR